MRAGTFKIIENWTIARVDRFTGEVLDKEEICNTIVNNGLERIAKLINGESSTHFRALGIGTGTTAVTTADTALETEYSRETATLSYEADYKSKFTKDFTFGSGVSENITEAGIFDSSTVSGSSMLAHTTFSAKAVSSTVGLTVTATITVARA